MDNAGKTDQKQRLIIGIDNTYEQILAFDKDATVELDWDYRALKKLPAHIQEQLKVESLKRYAVAEAKAEAVEREKGKNRKLVNPLGNTSGHYVAKSKIRGRRGWHQYWAKPGEDFERCMSTVYKQVRKPTMKQSKDGFEPGEEAGEILEIRTSEGKVEAIAVECPEKDYQTYLQWMSQESVSRYRSVNEDFGRMTEGINRELPRGSRITPGQVDEDSGTFKPL